MDGHVDVLAATDAPIDVGVRAVGEGPGRLRASVGVGWLPPAYLDGIDAVATSAGWYDEATASLIEAALDNCFVLRGHVGWRPWKKHGFHFEGGYGLATLGGGLTGADVVNAVADREVEETAGLEFLAHMTVHQLDVVVGWEWTIRRHFVVDVDLGGAFTVAARSRVEPDFVSPPRAEAAIDQLAAEAETYLETTAKTYVHTPTLSLAVGWRF